MVNDTDLKRPEDANYKVEMNSLKTAFEVGNSGQQYTPNYDSVSNNFAEKIKVVKVVAQNRQNLVFIKCYAPPLVLGE